MIGDEAFAELRADLDSSGGATGSYWHILKHAEAGGFDLAAMKRGIQSALKSYFRDEVYRFDDASERELVLDLRDRMRVECLLAPLSTEERRDWKWVDASPSRQYRQEPFDYMLRTTPDQHRNIASYMSTHHPESVRYLKWVRKHNGPLGYNGGPYDKYIVRQLWSYPFIQDAACEVLGETSEYNLDTRAVEEIAVAWPI